MLLLRGRGRSIVICILFVVVAKERPAQLLILGDGVEVQAVLPTAELVSLEVPDDLAVG